MCMVKGVLLLRVPLLRPVSIVIEWITKHQHITGQSDSWSVGWLVSLLDDQLAGVRPPVVHDWAIKGLGMSNHVCGAGHIKDTVPLVENER